MNHALRRAAILIASLDTDSADTLLDEMSPEQATLVRHAVMELGDISAAEQQQVMQQFVQHNSRAGSVASAENLAHDDAAADSGVEFDPELVRKFQSSSPSGPSPRLAQVAPLRPRPFAFLEGIDAGELAAVLANEHPQTAAIVVAHLAPARAAEVLQHLPPARQTDTLTRIARLSAPHPEVLRDLELEIQALLAHRGHGEPVAEDGLASVEAILQHASPHQRQDLVTGLAQQDRVLVRQLRISIPAGTADSRLVPTADRFASGVPERNTQEGQLDTRLAPTDPRTNRHLDFAELESLDQAALAHVLRRSNPNTTLLALAGASHAFVQKILGHLPSREASQLNRKIQHIGPVRLDDVQRAQQHLVDIAQQLIDEGTITLPRQQRFAVAA